MSYAINLIKFDFGSAFCTLQGDSENKMITRQDRLLGNVFIVQSLKL